jgi:hypothetical protein
VIESGPKEADFLELNKIYLQEKKSRVWWKNPPSLQF